MTTVLEIKDLAFRWEEQGEDFLKIPELTARKGERIFIGGESGSGKSTLLNLIAGIYRPRKGSLELLGKNPAAMKSTHADRFRAEHIGIIFQEFNLFPFLSLYENIVLPTVFAGRSKKAEEIKQRALNLVKSLRISEELLDKSVNRLSVGQQQRVAIARAMIAEPELIIADEPTSALDETNKNLFLDLLFSYLEQSEAVLIFVSHDREIARHFSKYIDINDFRIGP